MQGTVQKNFERFFNIRPDESRLVQAFFLYYTCIGMFITVGFTAGDSLFLTNVSQEEVHALYAWGHVGIAAATVIVTWNYSKVIGFVSRISLLVGMQLILLFSIFVFRQFIPSNAVQTSAWLYFGLVVWIKVCGQISIMLFFSFAGDYFTTRDAKRLYPYIAGGMAVGSIVAGTLISQVVPVIGSENMLYACMGFLTAGMGFSLFIHKIGTPVTRPENSPDTKTGAKTPLNAIISQSYIQLVFLVVLIGVICFVIVDFQMKISAKTVYSNSTDLAAFFGNFYMYAGIMTILVQFLVVEFLLRQFGIINCLMILPGIHMITNIIFYSTGYGLFAGHTLFIIASANFFRIILTESLDLPSRELLFLPLPFHIRVQAQAIMGGMMEPVGQGVGGLLIMSLSAFGIHLFRYSPLVLFFALVWVLILFLERPRYRDTLISSLRNNQLDATDLRDMVQGSSIDFVLEELLKSDEEQVVSFTLDLLQNRSLGGLSTQIRKLAIGSKSNIAAKSIEVLGADGDLGHLDTLERALKSDSDIVREAAVLAFCRIQKEKILERVSHWLDVPDPVIRHAALVGCGRYCGQTGEQLTQPILKAMLSSHLPEERHAGVRLLGDMQNPDYAFLVQRLLDDPHKDIRIAAIEVCGVLRVSAPVPHLLQLYSSPEMRVYVLSALEQMPEECVPAISEGVYDLRLDETSREMLLQVLASISGSAAQKSLWEFFSGECSVVIRVAAGNALQQIATYHRLQKVKETEFDRMLTRLDEKISLLNQGCREIGDRDEFVWQLLKDHARLEIECLFQLLACTYNVHQVEKVRYNFFSSSSVHQANALELLDDLLPRRIAPKIVQLLDSFIAGKTIENQGLTKDIAQQLLKQESWLRVITTYYLRNGNVASEIETRALLSEDERVLYTLLERIAFLKKVPLFIEVPGNYLVPLAKIAQPVHLKAGNTLFHQGDRGIAMYLICHGSISIQVNEVEVIRRGTGACIGEMSLLDGMSRSASCVALEETELLMISDSDFEMIVKNQTSVALAVLRTLVGRLRQQTVKTVQRQERPAGLHARKKKGVTTYHRNGGSFESETRAGESFTEDDRVLYHLLEKISFLKKIPLFAEIPEKYLVPLAKIAHSVELNSGENLFHQGERGDAMYLICHGSISVQVDGVAVNQMETGECIGEMALLDGTPRSASCIAIEDTELLRIADREFETIMKSQTTVAFALLRTLAGRLRRQTVNRITQAGT